VFVPSLPWQNNDRFEVNQLINVAQKKAHFLFRTSSRLSFQKLLGGCCCEADEEPELIRCSRLRLLLRLEREPPPLLLLLLPRWREASSPPPPPAAVVVG
jgi:hypothetical protein